MSKISEYWADFRDLEVAVVAAATLTVTLGGYYCHRRHRPMTPPRPACRRHKLSTIAISNDVRNMMGWVPLRSDYVP